MKFQVDKANLIQILQRVQNITDRKSTMPILVHRLSSRSVAETSITWSAVALTRQARETGRGYRDQVHTVMQAELSKPEPDLAAVAAAADAAQSQGQALRKQVRDAWLALYATFSPAQKAVVRDALATRMRKMDERRAAWGRG